MKQLVVEDEARVASFLDKGLRANGYDVEWDRLFPQGCTASSNNVARGSRAAGVRRRFI